MIIFPFMGIDIETPDALALHLAGLRRAKGLTLVELAERSGVSRASLSRIEAGAVSPTAQTLGRLSTAMATPISQLLAPLESQATAHVPRDQQHVWQDPSHGITRRVVSPKGGALRTEVLEIHLTPDQDVAYDAPSVPGQEHHLVLRAGALRMTVDGMTHDLNPGDCLRYLLRGGSRFQSGPEGACYTLVIL